MRRLAPVLLVFVLLCGCGAKVPEEPKSPLAGRAAGGYETAANITYKELQATATVSQASPDACTVTFTSPETIKDLVFVYTRDQVEVSYKGLSFQFDPGAMPSGAVADMMVDAVNLAMKNNGIAIDVGESGVELTGMLESGQFLLRLDQQEGNLLKLLVPSQELEIEFINFRFLE